MKKWMYQWIAIPLTYSPAGIIAKLNEEGAEGWEATGITQVWPECTNYLLKKEYT